MKKIKIFGFIMLPTFVAAVGCSKDETEQTNTPDLQLRTFGGGIDDYLSDYYGNATLKFNDSIKASDSLGDYLVKSIVVGNDVTARGYVVYDFTSGSPLYFADIDRSGYKMSTKDFITDEEETIVDIDTNPAYQINELDFIKIIDDVNQDNLTAYANIPVDISGTFWGTRTLCPEPTSSNVTTETFVNANNEFQTICHQTGCRNHRYRFFVAIGSKPVDKDPEIPCP